MSIYNVSVKQVFEKWYNFEVKREIVTYFPNFVFPFQKKHRKPSFFIIFCPLFVNHYPKMDKNHVFPIVLFFLARKNVLRKMLPLINVCQLFVRCVETSYNNDLVSVSRIFLFLSHILPKTRKKSCISYVWVVLFLFFFEGTCLGRNYFTKHMLVIH